MIYEINVTHVSCVKNPHKATLSKPRRLSRVCAPLQTQIFDWDADFLQRVRIRTSGTAQMVRLPQFRSRQAAFIRPSDKTGCVVQRVALRDGSMVLRLVNGHCG